MDAEEQLDYTHAHAFDHWLNDRLENNDMRTMDLILMMWSLYARMRAYLTVEQSLQIAWQGIHLTEQALQAGTAMLDPDTGESVNMLLAEERRAIGLDEVEVPNTVPEDWNES